MTLLAALRDTTPKPSFDEYINSSQAMDDYHDSPNIHLFDSLTDYIKLFTNYVKLGKIKDSYIQDEFDWLATTGKRFELTPEILNNMYG